MPSRTYRSHSRHLREEHECAMQLRILAPVEPLELPEHRTREEHVLLSVLLNLQLELPCACMQPCCIKGSVEIMCMRLPSKQRLWTGAPHTTTAAAATLRQVGGHRTCCLLQLRHLLLLARLACKPCRLRLEQGGRSILSQRETRKASKGRGPDGRGGLGRGWGIERLR